MEQIMGKKYFNVTGKCYPEQHYMVDISERLEQIKAMVDQGDYFCINCARQYGKTTTLSLLKKKLEHQYTVFSISFEGMGESSFETDEVLAGTFLYLLNDSLNYGEVKHVSDSLQTIIAENVNGEIKEIPFLKLSNLISRICTSSEKPVVLFIDEVDQAGNYRAFIDFLGLLRNKYLSRMERPTFHSVILASVYDIKNLKLKIRPDAEKQYNSPWNIAAEFNVNMDFTKDAIAGMLAAYEKDYQTGMDIAGMSELLYDYTSGYPFLVSRLCKLIDEKIAGTKEYPDKKAAWSKNGFLEAVKQLLSEPNTLFDDMRKKLTDYPKLRKVLYEVLYEGRSFPYNTDDNVLDIAKMFGYIKNCDEKVTIANRIFETRLYNLFVSEEQSDIYAEGSKDKNQFIQNGKLDMKRILERFVVHFTDLYGTGDEKFIEKTGRKFFLFYLKPIINGTGNYYVEAQTRNEGRTDVIVDYLGQQYVVELKIWHGNSYNERGEKQLFEYLDAYHLNKGYMLSFNFNKKKDVGVKEIPLGDKVLVEAVV